MCPRSIIIAGVPSSQVLPSYLITVLPPVCVPDVICALAVWIQTPKKKNHPLMKLGIKPPRMEERSKKIQIYSKPNKQTSIHISGRAFQNSGFSITAHHFYAFSTAWGASRCGDLHTNKQRNKQTTAYRNIHIHLPLPYSCTSITIFMCMYVSIILYLPLVICIFQL